MIKMLKFILNKAKESKLLVVLVLFFVIYAVYGYYFPSKTYLMCINQSLPDEPEFNKGLTIRKHWGGLKYSVNQYGINDCNQHERDYFIFDSFDRELSCSSSTNLIMSLDMISGKMTIKDSSDNYEEKYICKGIGRLIQ